MSKATGYTPYQFAGAQTYYQCDLCPMNLERESDMLEHIQNRHWIEGLTTIPAVLPPLNARGWPLDDTWQPPVLEPEPVAQGGVAGPVVPPASESGAEEVQPDPHAGMVYSMGVWTAAGPQPTEPVAVEAPAPEPAPEPAALEPTSAAAESAPVDPVDASI